MLVLGGCVPHSSGGGVIYGHLTANGQDAAYAAVYLSGASNTVDAAGSAPETSTLGITDPTGNYRIDAPAGDYLLVASAPGPVAAYVPVHVSRRVATQVDADLTDCQTTGTITNPCPGSYGPSPTPAPPSMEIGHFGVAYTDVTRGTDPTSTDPTLRLTAYGADFPGSITLTFDKPDGFTAGQSVPISFPNGSLTGLLEYDDPSGAVLGYVAVSGTASLTSWNPTSGGLVNVSLSNARFDWVDPNAGPNDTQVLTVDGTDPMSGTVVSGP